MINPNRKQRRANRKRNPVISPERRSLPKKFEGQFERLALIGGFAQHVSMAQTGLPTTDSGMLASMVFAKCCAHARSIGAIAIESPMFDHHTIMAIARMIMEGSTMIAYLLDPVSKEEWDFRHTVLRLHDTAGRIKLLRSFDAPTDDLRAGRSDLADKLRNNPCFMALDNDRQKRLLTGEEMFTVGMRAVATKIMGWDKSQFSGIYSYLSSHTHSAPISFLRMADHKIDYYNPSEDQISILALSMEVAIACHRRSLLRMIDQRPEDIELEYHSGILSDLRREDSECAFFVNTTTGNRTDLGAHN